ncbi:MAG: ABC transporter ATP-binding protein [Oscillospiraceae bacterium]|nr:ABC transporter ATP-binding protein [Oscillospiraceae bacterium]
MAGQTRNVRLRLENVCKSFKSRDGESLILDNINLDIYDNEFLCVVGPSGCGKSTLLNILAGLTDATSGTAYCDGVPIEGTGTERGVVFQQYALFPWLTVKKNVMFALEMRGIKGKEAEELAISYLEGVHLEDYANHYPKELSGGMKQRVAIARAYAAEPEVLLMDEPFGALDAQTRMVLQGDLLETWNKDRKTCFFITHDVEEAVFLSQRIVVMSTHPGRIQNIIDVPLPYPRTQELKMSPEFNEIRMDVWKQVYSEIL